MEDAIRISEKASNLSLKESALAPRRPLSLAAKWACSFGIVLFCLFGLLSSAGFANRIEHVQSLSHHSNTVNNMQVDVKDAEANMWNSAQNGGVLAGVKRLCDRYDSQGYYVASEKVHLNALSSMDQNKKEFAIHLRLYGDTLVRAGNLNAAENVFRQALDALEKSVGVHDPDYAETLLKLAKVCSSLGRYDEERELSAQAQKLMGF